MMTVHGNILIKKIQNLRSFVKKKNIFLIQVGTGAAASKGGSLNPICYLN